MRLESKIGALCATIASAALLASCDITPKSPVLAGDTGDSSNEAVGTILPDPPPAHPPSPGQHEKKKSLKPQDQHASEEGPE